LPIAPSVPGSPGEVNFRRLLNTRWQGVTWKLVINSGLRAKATSIEELVPGVWSLNGKLFALENITDIHFDATGNVVISVERERP
jgi:hypothetical protein